MRVILCICCRNRFPILNLKNPWWPTSSTNQNRGRRRGRVTKFGTAIFEFWISQSVRVWLQQITDTNNVRIGAAVGTWRFVQLNMVILIKTVWLSVSLIKQTFEKKRVRLLNVVFFCSSSPDCVVKRFFSRVVEKTSLESKNC